MKTWTTLGLVALLAAAAGYGLQRYLQQDQTLGDAPAGPALEVSFNHPTHVAFDPLGRLIISAWHNSKILRYDFLTEDEIQTLLDLPSITP